MIDTKKKVTNTVSYGSSNIQNVFQLKHCSLNPVSEVVIQVAM